MIRLTVLYNLPPGTDEAEFLRWRLGEHQQQNEAAPGVLRTDFARIDSQWTPDDNAAAPPYRFMTTADWPDLATFEASFFSEESLASLRADKEKIADAVFLISEVLISST
jgi:hypothetical protein